MTIPAFIQNLGVPELVIILLIVLVLFGAGRVSGLMRDFGKGIKEFKKGMKEDGDEGHKEGAGQGTQEPSVKGGDNGKHA